MITHGNGPQVGLLALQDTSAERFPLDVLDAETEGMIGYLIERELGNLLPDRAVATLLTMVEVDPTDAAFADPTKPVGPSYTKEEAEQLAHLQGWTIKRDENAYRGVVPSPRPQRIVEIEPINWLLEHGCIVICAGGGGIPTMRRGGALEGVSAVIDKDLASGLLAQQLRADLFVMAKRRLERASPATLRAHEFAAGSMAPKIDAACLFAEQTGRPAVIGSLDDLSAIVERRAGTIVLATEREVRSAPQPAGAAST